MSIRLVLSDDHPIVLDGLEQLFRLEDDFSVVARCRDGFETLRAVREHQPDVLVLDVAIPGKDGIEVLRSLHEEQFPTRVLLLTAALAERQLREAIRLGVAGVVLKETAPEILVEAVREVHAGRRWLEEGSVGPTLRKLAERDAGAAKATELLTPRELEIVRMVASGLRNRVIGERLFISEGTVKIHLHNIYRKLAVAGRLELAVYAQRHGLEAGRA